MKRNQEKKNHANNKSLTKFKMYNKIYKLHIILFLASVSMLSCPIGLLTIGILVDKIGRRKALQCLYIPMIVSWLTLAFANSYKTILIGKILLGVVYGKFYYFY